MAPNRIPSDSTATSSGGDDRMEVDSNPPSRNSSLTAPSIHEPSQTFTNRTQRISQLQTRLKNLQLDAQRQLNEQPKSTQLALTRQTRAIFQPYGRHGSEVLLSTSIANFLTSSSSNLTIWSATDATTAQASAKRKHSAGITSFANHVVSKALANGIPLPSDPSDPSSPLTTQPATPSQLTRLREIALTDSPLNGHRTLSRSPSTTDIIRSWSFHPADLTLTMPSHLALPAQLLPTVSRILDLYNLQANAHLEHLADKYLTLSPYPERSEHAYALLRLGVLQKYTELVEGLFDTRHTNAMGLSQAQSALLRDVYEKIGHRALSEREKEVLVRMLGIGGDEVEEWWGWMGRRVRAWKGVKVWVRARELEGVRSAKRTGVY